MLQAPSSEFPPALASLIPGPTPQRGIYTALGSAELCSWFLRALCAPVGRGMRLSWIDAGNGFDAYGLSRTARALGLDPRPVLRRISLARPFNAFQLETMVRRTLPARWTGEPVVLADPLAPLYDEDLPLPDAKKAAAGVLAGLRRLPAAWLVLAVARRAPEGRAEMLKNLVLSSKNLSLLGPDEGSLTLRPVERNSLNLDDGLPSGRLLRRKE